MVASVSDACTCACAYVCVCVGVSFFGTPCIAVIRPAVHVVPKNWRHLYFVIISRTTRNFEFKIFTAVLTTLIDILCNFHS